MITARKTAAVAALLVFGVLILRAVTPGSPLTQGRFEIAMSLLLAPLVMTGALVWSERAWGRWLALGAAVAVLPWAGVLTATPFMPTWPPASALAACTVLFLALSGRTMADRFEGSGRIPLVSWTIICNIASILVLYLFVGAYDYTVGWHVIATGSLLAGLLWGVSGLAAGRTAGILIVAMCAALLMPAASYFVAAEAVQVGEVFLLGAAFLPGILMTGACIARFGGPMWRLFRA